MATRKNSTRERIILAASKLFYAEGVRGVSVDAVAAQAGVTKRTLYYHFKSKDELTAAYLESRDQPNLALFKRWFAETEGGAAAKVRGIFDNLARAARHPKWKGCGFLRTSAELANLPGHPAMKIGAAHKKKSRIGCARFSRRRAPKTAWRLPGKSCCCSTAPSPSSFCIAIQATWRPQGTRPFR
jgi:AcrR family transcriptional regulator